MFFFFPSPFHTNNVLLPQRNKWKAALPSSTQLCMRISLYTWKWFIFVLVPLMFRHVFCFVGHQQTAEKLLAWQASGWLTLKIPKLTGCLSPFLHISGLTFWFSLSWGMQVCFSFFFLFVVPATEVMAGSKQTELSHRRKIFKLPALHINKSRATWSWFLVTVSGESPVFDEHYHRQIQGGWGKLHSRRSEELQTHRLTKKIRIILKDMNH